MDCNLDSNNTWQVVLTEKVRMVVLLPVTVAEFDGRKQQTFKEAIAKTAGPTVRADHVIIDAIKESTAARRLLNSGIRIDVRVNAVDKSAADAIAARLTKDSINVELQKIGLPPATLLEAAAVVDGTQFNQSSSSSGSTGGQPVESSGMIVGVVVAVLLVVTAAVVSLLYWRRKIVGPVHVGPVHVGPVEQDELVYPGTSIDAYHGTSLEAAMNIQEVGFDVQRSGSNAGAALGGGLYVTPTLEKALNYAKRMPCHGAILHLRVQLGQCYSVTANDSYNGNLANWQQMGYDSAYAGPGIIGEREEYCIKDPRHPRVVIRDITVGHTVEAKNAGYSVVNKKLRKS
jgi:hypothetical protein